MNGYKSGNIEYGGNAVAAMKNNTGVLLAGVAKSDITDAGKGLSVSDPLYVKALVLDDGATKIVFITMDIAAIKGKQGCPDIKLDVGENFMAELRARIQTELEIPGPNVLVNASHNHSAGCSRLCGGEKLLEKTVDTVSKAAQSMVEAEAGSGIGREDRISMNRILRLKNGRHWTIRHAYPCPPDEDVVDVGPTDPDIGVIAINHAGGRPLAVVYNFACHPITGVAGKDVSANLPGFASKVIEENLGHGAMAFFLQGAGGDIAEIFYKDIGCPRNTEALGTMLGLSALKALRNISAKTDIQLGLVSGTVELPFRTDIAGTVESLEKEQAGLLASLRGTSLNIKTFLQLYIQNSTNPDYPSDYSYKYLQEQKSGSAELARMDAGDRRNIEKYLNNIRAMEKLSKIQGDIAVLKAQQELISALGGDGIAVEAQGIKIGDCVVLASPCELLVEIGLNIKKASPYKKTFIAAYSNGNIHYAPPASYYGKGSYETNGCLLAPEWQRIYEKKAKELIACL